MLSLRPALRLLTASSSAEIPLARGARFLATGAGSDAAEPQQHRSHVVQSRPRPRTLRQVGEEGGSTAQLVALAVKNTQVKGEEHGTNRAHAMQRQGQGQGQEQGQPRQRRSPEEHRAWLESRLAQRKAAAAGGPAQEGGAPREPRMYGGERRRFTGPPRGDGAPRRPRGDRSSSPSGPPGADGKPRTPFRPQQRRAPRPSASGLQWPAEATRPLTPPSTVHYPGANLAQLLRADLASKAVQLKCALGGTEVVNEDAETREEREQAKKVLGGDYSLWVEAGEGQGKGKEGVVEHARGVLKSNASVPLSQRQVLLQKIREAVL
ncbi:hypothetical protein JCM10450v2_002608 [Rhodotorula kratochvilovae]